MRIMQALYQWALPGLLIVTTVSLLGCSSSTIPLRSQIHTGMTQVQLWQLYGFNAEDAKTLNCIPKMEIVNEEETEKCTRRSYRYWLIQDKDVEKLFSKPTPFLLTFESCKLPNYDEVQEQTNQMMVNIFRANPSLEETIEVFCKENKIYDPENKILLLGLLGYFDPLKVPSCKTDFILIKVELDEVYLSYSKAEQSSKSDFSWLVWGLTGLADMPNYEQRDQYGGYSTSGYYKRTPWNVWSVPVTGFNEDALQPLFGSQGQTIYFLDESGRVINRDGQSVAWIDNNGNVYDYEGEHQGWFKGGHIRGRDGGVMVYRPGAQGLGVIPPIPQIPPIPPIPEIEPIRPIPSIPPIEPIPQLGWSDYGLE